MSGSSRVVSDKLSAPAPCDSARSVSATLSDPITIGSSRKVSGEYGGMYIPDEPVLVISDLIFTIARDAIMVSYATNADTTCRITYASPYNAELMMLDYKFFSPNHATHLHQITGLAEGTSYRIQIRVFDSSGNNAFSPAVSSWHVVRTGTIETPGEDLPDYIEV